MSNYLEDLFINEAKPALRAKNCSGSGGSDGVEINNQDKTITANGVYSADEGFTGLGNVYVNVAPTGDGWEQLDAMIDRSIRSVSSNTTSIGNYAFDECKRLTTVDFPLVTSIGNYAFNTCESLTTVDFPLVTSIGNNVFDGCKHLTTVDFPLATYINAYNFRSCESLITVDFPLVTAIGKYAFCQCENLTTVDCPLVTSIGDFAFSQCESLTTVDFPLLTSIGKYAFQSCDNLTMVTLRKTEIVCALSNKNAFTITPIESGTGYIYVPSALIEDYKAATNWSTYAAQFRALEDYTVDGTVTGELDETKI